VRIEGRVGVARYADDQEGPPRLGTQGEVVIAPLNPAYYEQTMRGNAFIYSVPAAGAALAALGVNTAPFIWNPAGNNKLLLITKVAVGLVSVTATAGHIVYGSSSNLGSASAAARHPSTTRRRSPTPPRKKTWSPSAPSAAEAGASCCSPARESSRVNVST